MEAQKPFDYDVKNLPMPLINLISSIFRCLVAFAKVENFDWNIKNRESKTVAYKAVVTYNVKLVKILLTIKSSLRRKLETC